MTDALCPTQLRELRGRNQLLRDRTVLPSPHPDLCHQLKGLCWITRPEAGERGQAGLLPAATAPWARGTRGTRHPNRQWQQRPESIAQGGAAPAGCCHRAPGAPRPPWHQRRQRSQHRHPEGFGCLSSADAWMTRGLLLDRSLKCKPGQESRGPALPSPEQSLPLGMEQVRLRC